MQDLATSCQLLKEEKQQSDSLCSAPKDMGDRPPPRAFSHGLASLDEADYQQRHICMLETLKSSQIIRSGHLSKRRRTSKSWKKQWLVLRSSHISIYENEKEYATKHMLLLCNVHAVCKTRLRHHPFAWALFTKPRTWYFEASSDEEAAAWVADIKRLLASEPLVANDSLLPLIPSSGDSLLPKPLITSAFASAPASGLPIQSPVANSTTNAGMSIGQPDDMFSPTCSELLCSSPDFSSESASPKSNESASSSPALSHADRLISELDIHSSPAVDPERDVCGDPLDHCRHHYLHLFRRRKKKTGIAILDFESHLMENMKLEDAKLLMQGYLEKYHGPYRKWTRHWFVLRDFNLACYENENEYVLLRLIRLQKVTRIQAFEPIGKHHPYTIKIETFKKSLIVATKSLNELYRWLRALQEQHAKIFD